MQSLADGDYSFVWSYILEFENSKNPYPIRRETIHKFSYRCGQYVDESKAYEIVSIAEPIISSGVKEKDALHIACAIYSSCGYFLTTDDRLLKYRTERINVMSPVQFVNEMEDNL